MVGKRFNTLQSLCDWQSIAFVMSIVTIYQFIDFDNGSYVNRDFLCQLAAERLWNTMASNSLPAFILCRISIGKAYKSI